MAFECGIQKRIDTDTRKFDSNSRSSLPTLSQKVHGSFAFWPCSGKVEALLQEQKIGIGIWDPKRYMVPLPFWHCFGKVEALLRKKVTFKCGTKKRMETQTDTGKIDSNSRSSLLMLS